MKKFASQFLLFSSFSLTALAQDFPNITGSVLTQLQVDHVGSVNRSGVSANNGYIYVEPNISFNINKNWSIKTDWRLQPNDTLTTRNGTYPERYRTILQSGRGFGMSDEGILIEELKVNYENEDMDIYAGKYDPTFGTAYRKDKRMGVFTAQFGEDYNLREKIGVGGVAILESSKISVNTFFNDTTALSKSAIDDRGRAPRNDGAAGNTGTLSSYSVAMNGESLFGFENWHYNLGYRNLDVDKIDGRSREKGYTIGTDYAYHVGVNSTITPFFEAVKIQNFSGIQGRDAIYTTAAVIGKYSNWNASITNLTRNIKQAQTTPKSSDRMLQLSTGYKFGNGLMIDFTRANMKEGGTSAVVYGLMGSYVYKF
jgi:hypothetical protein